MRVNRNYGRNNLGEKKKEKRPIKKSVFKKRNMAINDVNKMKGQYN